MRKEKHLLKLVQPGTMERRAVSERHFTQSKHFEEDEQLIIQALNFVDGPPIRIEKPINVPILNFEILKIIADSSSSSEESLDTVTT